MVNRPEIGTLAQKSYGTGGFNYANNLRDGETLIVAKIHFQLYSALISEKSTRVEMREMFPNPQIKTRKIQMEN